MPRYRTIACDHCGHMLLKRDTECEVCGCTTRRGRRLGVAKAVQLGIVLAAAIVIYATIKGLGPL
jgi:hypothetical protein